MPWSELVFSCLSEKLDRLGLEASRVHVSDDEHPSNENQIVGEARVSAFVIEVADTADLRHPFIIALALKKETKRKHKICTQ